jgi:hypothetical protein
MKTTVLGAVSVLGCFLFLFESGCDGQTTSDRNVVPIVRAESVNRLVKLQVHPYPGYEYVLTQGLGRTEPVRFVATGIYTDGTTQDLTTVVTWSSTDLDVISFGGTILTPPYVSEWIWGISPGTASLVATAPIPSTLIGLSDVVGLAVH